jgi:hypothetical protein
MATALHLIGTWLAVVLPHVEDPWPRSVGLELPFTFAGGGGVIGNILAAGRPPEEQARLTSACGLRAFWAGTAAYFLLLLNQILSSG